MKKALQLAIGLVIISNGAFAQWNGTALTGDTYRFGNVGVGTSTPATDLHINRQNYGSILLGNNTNEGVAITKELDNRMSIWNNGQFGQSQSERFTLLQNGNIGIGTSAPGSRLSVISGNNSIALFQNSSAANSYVTVANSIGGMNMGVGALTPHPYLWSNTGTFFVGNDGNPTLSVYGMNNGTVGIGTVTPAAKLDLNFFNPAGEIPQSGLLLQTNSFYTPNNANNSYYMKTLDKGNGSVAFIIKGNGQVGIGTENIGSCKLAVDGRIGARGIKVTVDPNFPDYVFEPSYKLRPLANLEQFINQNKHLPGIPSAEEVKKEGGIELGDMNVKLLEKIEELTLYVIELKKENEQMKKEIKAMKEKK